ncbi:MAG: PAS domain S-box protein [Chloroflexi bacterium]|nr:PAS domain S-box protein [Chloroflexota bacterium]
MNIIKILLIEENSERARFTRDLLVATPSSVSAPPTFDIHQANQLDKAVAFLNTIQFDAILFNITFPEITPIDAYEKVAAAAAKVPIVIVSNDEIDDDELASNLMHKGAQDYLHKDVFQFHGVLNRTVRHAIERQRLRVELEEKTKELAISESRRKAIIEQNADGIIIVNKKGIVRFVNPAAEKLLRSSKEDLLGHLFRFPVVHGGTAELTVKRRTGGTASIEMRLVDTEWEGEKVYQASLRDISNHQQAKAEIMEKANELSIQNMALDEFAHTMAHQIQGLLSQMVGYASYIEMHYAKELNEEVQHSLNRIIQSGNKMNNVISELLLLASMRSEEVNISPLDMRRISSEVQKRLRFQIRENDAIIEEPSDWPVTLGHEAWIEEALLNYVGNAIKYGGDPPHMQLGATILPEGMVRIWVKDNGHGMSETDQRRLFQPHTRLHQTNVTGDGLGLSIVHRIIHRCGGKVGVESEIGKGSTFWFTLPQANNEEAA